MYDILQLNDMLVPELLDIADQFNILNAKKLDKQTLIYKILDAQVLANTTSKPTKLKKGKREKKSPITGLTKANYLDITKNKSVPSSNIPIIDISIDPGTAPNEEIASILADISLLYRQMNGSGIVFKLDHVTLNQEVDHEL